MVRRAAVSDRNMFPQEMNYSWKEILSPEAESYDHWDWRSRIVDSQKMCFGSGNQRYVIEERKMKLVKDILEGYDMIVTIRNAFRYFIARPVKRAFIKAEIIRYSLR